MEYRVYYEDTDAQGVVYHTSYLKFCERARSELFFKNSMMPATEEGFFVVKSLSADFFKSAILGDMLKIKTSILNAKKASIELLQEVYKESVKTFSLKILLVFVKNNRPSRIPARFIEILRG